MRSLRPHYGQLKIVLALFAMATLLLAGATAAHNVRGTNDDDSSFGLVYLGGASGVCNGTMGWGSFRGDFFQEGDCEAAIGDTLKFGINLVIGENGTNAWSIDLAWDENLQNSLDLVQATSVTSLSKGFENPSPAPATIGYNAYAIESEQNSSSTTAGRVNQISGATAQDLTLTISNTSFRAATITFQVNDTAGTDIRLGFFRTDGAAMGNSASQFMTPRFGNFSINDERTDPDGDGVEDSADNCPDIGNQGQEDADNNGTGDACNNAEDSDSDDWADKLDNCPTVANPSQSAVNGSSFGDACDPDRDSDGVGNQGSIGAQRVITTAADYARSVYAADLDGDGDMDVLSASWNDDKIAWYENTDGLGNFGPQQVITTAANFPISVYATDIDGDHDMDVLSASFLDSKIAWHENTDGLGNFGPQQVITTAAKSANSVYAADLDGDHDIDVLSSSLLDDKIAWYKNTDGRGNFGSQQVITTAADGAWSVYAADLDADGDMDVLSASSYDDKIAWHENTDGLGSFGSQQVITTATDGAYSVDAADLDGDGDIDVLSASWNDDKIAWYENTDGRGSFGSQQVITTAADGAWSVYAADLDGNGAMDVLSASSYDNKIAWYENTEGLGSFGAQQVITTAADYARSVYASDLDGDGDMDVLSASSYDDKIAWYENGSPDNCPDAYNPDQTDVDHNGVADACNDAEDFDGDDWADELDNCPVNSNFDQANSDSDAAGNACDAFPNDPNEDADTDGDRIGDNADPCFNGSEQTGTTTCGLNGEGLWIQTCTTGGWVDGETCTGTDVCVNGSEQTGTTACGLANEGFLFQTCSGGDWVNSNDCSSNDADGDGFTDEEEIAAGTDPLDINSIPAPEPASVFLQLTALLTLAGLRMRRRRAH